MKNLLGIALCAVLLSSCTKDLGTINYATTRPLDEFNNYEVIHTGASFTSESVDNCVNLALKSTPNAAFLKNLNIQSKGKKVTITADVWGIVKSQKNKDLKLDRYKDKASKAKKPVQLNGIRDMKLKEGSKVEWNHPKFGRGQGTIIKLGEEIAQVKVARSSDPKAPKEIKLPIKSLKLIK
jgi:hypothetical protein